MSSALTLAPAPHVVQADTDQMVIRLWLHNRPTATQASYRYAAGLFFRHCGKPLSLVTLADIQAFADSITDRSPATQATYLSAIKSLITFAHRLGYLPLDVGWAIRLPYVRDQLPDRIITREQVEAIIAAEPDPRNRLILSFLYATGLRVSEVAALKWRDLRERGDGGQLTTFGKRGKTRTVLIPAAVWQQLMETRNGAMAHDPVFVRVSHGPGHLTNWSLWEMVRKAAARAGLEEHVSPHWFRHAHASHAIDAGAPLHVVQHSLGHSDISTTGRYLHARPGDGSGNYLEIPEMGDIAGKVNPSRVVDGPALRAARVRLGLSQAELAGRFGIGTCALMRIEQGKTKRPTPKVTAAINRWLEEAAV